MRWSKLAAVGICIIVAQHELADEPDDIAEASTDGKVPPGKVAADAEETIDFFADPMGFIQQNLQSFFSPASGAAATSAAGKVSLDKVTADTEEKIDFFVDPVAYITQNWRSFMMPALCCFMLWNKFQNKAPELQNKAPEAKKLAFTDKDGDDCKFELDGRTLTCAVKERTWTGKWMFDNNTNLLKCEDKDNKQRLIVKVPKDKGAEVQSLVEKSR